MMLMLNARLFAFLFYFSLFSNLRNNNCSAFLETLRMWMTFNLMLNQACFYFAAAFGWRQLHFELSAFTALMERNIFKVDDFGRIPLLCPLLFGIDQLRNTHLLADPAGLQCLFYAGALFFHFLLHLTHFPQVFFAALLEGRAFALLMDSWLAIDMLEAHLRRWANVMKGRNMDNLRFQARNIERFAVQGKMAWLLLPERRCRWLHLRHCLMGGTHDDELSIFIGDKGFSSASIWLFFSNLQVLLDGDVGKFIEILLRLSFSTSQLYLQDGLEGRRLFCCCWLGIMLRTVLFGGQIGSVGMLQRGNKAYFGLIPVGRRVRQSGPIALSLLLLLSATRAVSAEGEEVVLDRRMFVGLAGVQVRWRGQLRSHLYRIIGFSIKKSLSKSTTNWQNIKWHGS